MRGVTARTALVGRGVSLTPRKPPGVVAAEAQSVAPGFQVVLAVACMGSVAKIAGAHRHRSVYMPRLFDLLLQLFVASQTGFALDLIAGT